MTLNDLLDTLRRDILRDTSDDVVEGDDPRLWTDTTLIRYINEAQRIFAKKSGVLRQKMTFDIIPLTDSYELPAQVFAVVSAKYLGNASYVNGVLTLNPGIPTDASLVGPPQGDLARTGHAALDHWRLPDCLTWDVNAFTTMLPGRVIAYDTDEVTGTTTSGVVSMRLYPVPSPEYGGQIEARVLVLPPPLLATTMDQECGLPEDYHMQMLDYAAFRALKIVDHEAGDIQRAQDMRDEFDKNCELARRDTLRKMFTPQRWGFGRNGFTYAGN